MPATSNPTSDSCRPSRRLLWWARSGHEDGRNRVVRAALAQLNVTVDFFTPRTRQWSAFEAMLARVERPDVVWVPVFRHRDVLGAARWCRRRKVPLVFDPLISQYDKQVFEKQRFAEDSSAAQRLLKRERILLTQPQAVLVDTQAHSDYFENTLAVNASKLHVVPVGAEEGLFEPEEKAQTQRNAGPFRVVFVGSFISLQGPQVIVEAARRCPDIQWTLVGEGPDRSVCEAAAQGLANVQFKPWQNYRDLPSVIRAADVALGVFGASEKAQRVVPNKVHQALACGVPVITRVGTGYPPELPSTSEGLVFVKPDDPDALATAIRAMAEQSSEAMAAQRRGARLVFDTWFGPASIRQALIRVLDATLCDVQ
ncbi:MAG: glycosyltransferase [Algisphaera sp.]